MLNDQQLIAAGVDTIVIRIKNVRTKYQATYNGLKALRPGAKTKVWFNEDTGEVVDDSGFSAVLYHDTRRSYTLAHRTSIFIASSHYTLSTVLSYEKDMMEFNFSIPKFKYLTNLFQFINYYDQSVERMFSELIKFIGGFLSMNFFIDKIDLDDVEINRLDLCYNQFFASKNDALQYFNAQKALYGKKMVVRADESLTIVKDRYSFKIYHKGAEFRKHDMKELMAGYGRRAKQGIGSRKAGNPFGYDIEHMAQVADRILRYEITFRNSMFNYIFHRLYASKGRQAKPGVYRVLYGKYKIDDRKAAGLSMLGSVEQKKKVKNKQINVRRKDFYVKSRYDDHKEILDLVGGKTNKFIDQFIGDHNVTFNLDIMFYMQRFFWTYVKKYQVKNTVSEHEFRKRLGVISQEIEVKNIVKSEGSKLPGRNMNRLLHYAMMSKNMSLEELKDQGILSRSQFYKIKADLVRADLGVFNPDIAVVKPSLDYQEYKYLFGNFHHW